jgi:hypothetical protein
MRPTTMPFLASGGASMPKCWRVSAGGRDPRLMFRRFVSAQTVVNDGDLRQRKISERDALVIGGKQNDVREHVANLADNLEQDCVLCVCHGSTRLSSKSSRLIGLTDPSRGYFLTEHSGQKGPPRLADAIAKGPGDNWVQPVGRPPPYWL